MVTVRSLLLVTVLLGAGVVAASLPTTPTPQEKYEVALKTGDRLHMVSHYFVDYEKVVEKLLFQKVGEASPIHGRMGHGIGWTYYGCKTRCFRVDVYQKSRGTLHVYVYHFGPPEDAAWAIKPLQ